MFHFVSTVSVASRNLRASTPLLIDGHAVGNADINRRVVIRACAPCLAWKTIFHTGDNSCRPGRPLLPSFLPHPHRSLSPSLARSLARACYCRCFSFFTRRPSFSRTVSRGGVALTASRNFVRFVSSMQGQTHIDSYSHVYSSRTSWYSSNEQIKASAISANALKFTSLPPLFLTRLFYSSAFGAF